MHQSLLVFYKEKNKASIDMVIYEYNNILQLSQNGQQDSQALLVKMEQMAHLVRRFNTNHNSFKMSALNIKKNLKRSELKYFTWLAVLVCLFEESGFL